jgi:mannosyltransferase
MLTQLRRVSAPMRFSDAVGLLLLAIAILIPSALFANWIVGRNANADASLRLGATILRFNLGALGLLVLVLPRLPIWETPTASSTAATPPREKIILLCLGALLVAATALRLYRLGEGLWLDEILTDVTYVRQPLGVLLTSFEGENQHFLYSILAYLSYQIFGASAWALRLPAVLFGVASIGALYLVGRRVTCARETLLAAALLTVTYQHIWFSQNARGYTGLLFWALVTSWLFLRGVEETRTRTWVLYAVAAALGMFTQFTMIFVIAGHFILYGLYLLARRHAKWNLRWTSLFVGFGLAGFCTLLIYSLVLPQVVGGMGRETSLVDAWKNPLWTLSELLNGIQLSFSGSVAVVGAMFVLGAGLWSYARSKPVVIGLLWLPALLCAAVVVALGHHLWPRFFFFEIGFAALVVVRGAVVLGEFFAGRILKWDTRKASWLGSALGIGLVLVAALSIPLVYGPKQDYGGAMAFVESEKQPGDAVATSGVATVPLIEFYRAPWAVTDNAAALDALRASSRRTWFVYTFPEVLRAQAPDVMQMVEREFRVVKIFYGTVGDGAVIVTRYDAVSASLDSR